MKPKTVVVRGTADLFQRDAAEAFKQLSNIPLLDGVLVEDVVFASITVRVSHRLGRPYRGYIIVKQSASASLWVDATASGEDANYIPLRSSAAVKVSLWVF